MLTIGRSPHADKFMIRRFATVRTKRCRTAGKEDKRLGLESWIAIGVFVAACAVFLWSMSTKHRK